MDVPIACTLSEAELSDRRALWRRIEGDVMARRRGENRLEVVYAASAEVERVLPSLVNAESRCCGFATWRLTRDADQIVLTVAGPPDAVAALSHEFGIERR